MTGNTLICEILNSDGVSLVRHLVGVGKLAVWIDSWHSHAVRWDEIHLGIDSPTVSAQRCSRAAANVGTRDLGSSMVTGDL